jgi:WXXGXW repeat (2 copies)
MKMRVGHGVLATALGLLVLGATPAFAGAPHPPPAVQVEKPPHSPGPQFVWIAGHWAWTGSAYAWVDGRWVQAQGTWIPGRHVKTAEGWVYQEGRWKK